MPFANLALRLIAAEDEAVTSSPKLRDVDRTLTLVGMAIETVLNDRLDVPVGGARTRPSTTPPSCP